METNKQTKIEYLIEIVDNCVGIKLVLNNSDAVYSSFFVQQFHSINNKRPFLDIELSLFLNQNYYTKFCEASLLFLAKSSNLLSFYCHYRLLFICWNVAFCHIISLDPLRSVREKWDFFVLSFFCKSWLDRSWNSIKTHTHTQTCSFNLLRFLVVHFCKVRVELKCKLIQIRDMNFIIDTWPNRCGFNLTIEIMHFTSYTEELWPWW